jgi:YesN/AraC family two-component response regulator
MTELLAGMQFNQSEVYYVSNPDLTLKRIYEMISLLEGTDPLRMVDASAICYQLLLDLVKYRSGTDIKSKQQHMDQLLPVLQFIEHNYNESITLAQLADQLHVTPQYTCQMFQQSLGMRPFEYIIKYRIRKAKEMLVNQIQLQIKEIGQKVGFEHTSYFIKVFKQYEGITPSVFRSIHRVPE